MKDILSEAINGLRETKNSNKYNMAVGFFQGYSESEADSLGVRFATIKLHYKNDDDEDISATVALVYPGSKSTILDYRLESGDELLVFFTDRTLEQWKDTSGNVPQKLSNKVRNSINHGIAIPVCSHHNSALVSTTEPGGAVRLGVKAGKKMQLGNDTVDLIDLFDQLLTALAGSAVQNVGTAATPSPLINMATYLSLQTLLAQIKV